MVLLEAATEVKEKRVLQVLVGGVPELDKLPLPQARQLVHVLLQAWVLEELPPCLPEVLNPPVHSLFWLP